MARKGKKNSNSNTAVKRRKSQQRSRAAPPRMNSNVAMGPATQKYARSLTDPFTFAGCIPDGALGVGCFSVKQEINLSTGIGGSCCAVACAPVLQSFAYVDSSSASSTPTFSAASFWSRPASVISINALYRAFRPISMGLRGVFIGNTATDQGVILVGVLASGSALSALNGATLANAANLFRSYKIMPLRGGCQIAWRPQDMIDTCNFSNTGVSAATLDTSIQTPILACLVYSAAANSGCLQVELVANFEGLFWEQQFMAGGLEDSARMAAEPGWYEKAMNYASHFDQIAPLVVSVARGYNSGGLYGAVSGLAQAMGNGYAYPRVDSQSINGNKRRNLLTY